MKIEKWRPYLQCQEFIICTNHKSLSFLTEQNLHSDLQRKAMTRLMGLQFKVVYCKGKENVAADALSRCVVDTDKHLMSLSSCTWSWLEKLQEGYQDDPVTKQLLTELSLNASSNSDYSLSQGIIRYKGRIWVGQNLLAQNHILQALHASGIGGHSEIGRASCRERV